MRKGSRGIIESISLTINDPQSFTGLSMRSTLPVMMLPAPLTAKIGTFRDHRNGQNVILEPGPNIRDSLLEKESIEKITGLVKETGAPVWN